jgi:hypothetical protein
MKAGMIIRSKLSCDDRRWFIKKEGEIKRNSRGFVTMVKGYRVAPLQDLEHGFWITEEQMLKRFKESL